MRTVELTTMPRRVAITEGRAAVSDVMMQMLCLFADRVHFEGKPR